MFTVMVQYLYDTNLMLLHTSKTAKMVKVT